MPIASRLFGTLTLLACTAMIGCGATDGEDGSSSSSSSSSGSSSSSSSSGQPNSVIKILPMGGSTTQGISRSPGGLFSLTGGYRPHLLELALNDGKLITFVGGMSDGPDEVAGQPFPKNHEGHPGWMVSDFSEIVPIPALSSNPDIVLLAVGLEDMSTTLADKAVVDVVTLVRGIAQNQPSALVVLLPLPDGLAQVEATRDFNTAINALARESDSDQIVLAKMGWSTLTWAQYPDEEWYRAIARSFYEAIQPHLQNN